MKHNVQPVVEKLFLQYAEIFVARYSAEIPVYLNTIIYNGGHTRKNFGKHLLCITGYNADLAIHLTAELLI
jgi:hypothetical protein